MSLARRPGAEQAPEVAAPDNGLALIWIGDAGPRVGDVTSPGWWPPRMGEVRGYLGLMTSTDITTMLFE